MKNNFQRANHSDQDTRIDHQKRQVERREARKLAKAKGQKR